MNFTMKDLEEKIKKADELSAGFIGVLIQMQGFEKPEIIINERENFEAKLVYYKKSYNEDLTLKAFNGIKIINCAWGYDLNSIQKQLLGWEINNI